MVEYFDEFGEEFFITTYENCSKTRQIGLGSSSGSNHHRDRPSHRVWFPIWSSIRLLNQRWNLKILEKKGEDKVTVLISLFILKTEIWHQFALDNTLIYLWSNPVTESYYFQTDELTIILHLMINSDFSLVLLYYFDDHVWKLPIFFSLFTMVSLLLTHCCHAKLNDAT